MPDTSTELPRSYKNDFAKPFECKSLIRMSEFKFMVFCNYPDEAMTIGAYSITYKDFAVAPKISFFKTAWKTINMESLVV